MVSDIVMLENIVLKRRRTIMKYLLRYNPYIFLLNLRWWIMKSTVKNIVAQISRDSVLSPFFNGLSSYSAITITWLLALFLAIGPLLGWSHYEPEISGMR